MLIWLITLVGICALGQASSNETDDWARQSVLSDQVSKQSPETRQSPPDQKDDDLVSTLYELPKGVTEFLVGRTESTTLVKLKKANGLGCQPLLFSENELLLSFQVGERFSDKSFDEIVKDQLTQIIQKPSPHQSHKSNDKKHEDSYK
jgi:hypothetical protein